jgi:hypothetical protein
MASSPEHPTGALLPSEVEASRPRVAPSSRPSITRQITRRFEAVTIDVIAFGVKHAEATSMALLLLAPFVLGNLWLGVFWVTGASIDGMMWLEGYLSDDVPAFYTFNFWMIAIIGCLPIYLSMLMYTTLHDCEVVARSVMAANGGRLHGADDHAQLVQGVSRLFSRQTWWSSIMLALYFTSITVGFYELLVYRFLILQGIPQQMVEAVFFTSVGIGCFYFPVLFRDLRVGIMRREGTGVIEYVRTQKVLVARVLMGACFAFAYIISRTVSFPPLTMALTNMSGVENNPCAIARNETYIATHCKLNTEPTGPRLLCVDGGWRDYSSAETACLAARAYPNAHAKLFCTFGLHLNALAVLLVQTIKHTLAQSKHKFPLIQAFSSLLSQGILSVFPPIYLSNLVVDTLDTSSWLNQALSTLWVVLINILLWWTVVISANFELIFRKFDALMSGAKLEVALVDGKRADAKALISRYVQEGLVVSAASDLKDDAKFAANQLTSGSPAVAALGLKDFMRCTPTFVMPSAEEDGVAAIEAEFERAGTDEDKECLDYVLRRVAGASERRFTNANRRRDCDENDIVLPSRKDKAFVDFVNDPNARVAHLRPAHVLALRLYTTAAFTSLNAPMRRLALPSATDRDAHDFPVTLLFLHEAILKLRAVGAAESDEPLDLWRGLKALRVQDNFERTGGTEPAPMSTTTDLHVALAYSLSPSERSSLLFKIRTTSFMNRGASVEWLSAFPAEKEILYPPLTFLRPTGKRLLLDYSATHHLQITVVEVEPIN